jgi:hypothetical protein
MWHDGKSGLQRALSWFLIAYLAMLLGVLLGVHLLQWGAERPAGASRAPSRQERVMAVSKQAAVGRPMRRAACAGLSGCRAG